MSELTEEERAEQGPIKDSITRAAYWTQQIINVPISNGYNSLRDHVLPVPAMYLTLFYCVGCLIGIPPSSMRDPCGDLSWDAIKKVWTSFLLLLTSSDNIIFVNHRSIHLRRDSNCICYV